MTDFTVCMQKSVACFFLTLSDPGNLRKLTIRGTLKAPPPPPTISKTIFRHYEILLRIQCYHKKCQKSQEKKSTPKNFNRIADIFI